MVDNYDGYLFHEEAESRVFNATLVMYFMKHYSRFLKIPKELMDTNIAFNYGKLGNLLRLQDNKYYLDIIDALLKTGELKGKFNLEEDLMSDDIISLLYYFGYLTIKESGYGSNFVFQIPNYVMKELYSNYFLKILRDYNIIIDSNIINDCIKEIVLEGKIDKINHYIEEILTLSDNRVFQNFDEKYIQMLYFGLLVGKRKFTIYNEYPCKGGYIDLMILRNSDLCKWDIMIELKYLKKEEAILQLNHYQEDERIKKDTLRKYVVIFIGSKLKVLEEVRR